MLSPLIGARRSPIEILREILSICANGEVNKTAIMYRCNLSYQQLCKYLSLLSGNGLISKNDGGRFEITREGQKTLRQASGLIKTLHP